MGDPLVLNQTLVPSVQRRRERCGRGGRRGMWEPEDMKKGCGVLSVYYMATAIMISWQMQVFFCTGQAEEWTNGSGKHSQDHNLPYWLLATGRSWGTGCYCLYLCTHRWAYQTPKGSSKLGGVKQMVLVKTIGHKTKNKNMGRGPAQMIDRWQGWERKGCGEIKCTKYVCGIVKEQI